jgi:hypothetical protein
MYATIIKGILVQMLDVIAHHQGLRGYSSLLGVLVIPLFRHLFTKSALIVLVLLLSLVSNLPWWPSLFVH